MRVADLRLRPARGPHRAPSRRAAGSARACWSSPRRAAGRRPRHRPARICCARRRAGRQRHAGAAGRTEGHPHPRREPLDGLVQPPQAGRRQDLARLRPAGQAAARCSTGSSSAMIGSLLATVAGKGETGEVTLEFDLGGAATRRGHQVARRHAAAALYRGQARRRGARQDRLPDRLCRRRRRRRRADGRAPFHREPAAEARRHGRHHRAGDAACRGRDLPADEGRRHRRPRHACRMGRDRPRPSVASARRRESARAAASSPSAPPACACSKRRRAPPARCSPFIGDTDIFITPGFRFRAVDVLMTNFHLPQIDAVHAGQRLCRARDDEGGLRACDRDPLPVLFLWRRQPAVPRSAANQDDDRSKL